MLEYVMKARQMHEQQQIEKFTKLMEQSEARLKNQKEKLFDLSNVDWRTK